MSRAVSPRVQPGDRAVHGVTVERPVSVAAGERGLCVKVELGADAHAASLG
jgi:hypothetical protein